MRSYMRRGRRSWWRKSQLPASDQEGEEMGWENGEKFQQEKPLEKWKTVLIFKGLVTKYGEKWENVSSNNEQQNVLAPAAAGHNEQHLWLRSKQPSGSNAAGSGTGDGSRARWTRSRSCRSLSRGSLCKPPCWQAKVHAPRCTTGLGGRRDTQVIIRIPLPPFLLLEMSISKSEILMKRKKRETEHEKLSSVKVIESVS